MFVIAKILPGKNTYLNRTNVRIYAEQKYEFKQDKSTYLSRTKVRISIGQKHVFQ